MANLFHSLSARLWRLAQQPSIPHYRQEVAAILEGCSPQKPVILFPPGLDWTGQLFQRPQQLARSLARQGALVFYTRPDHTAAPSGISLLEENLYLCHVPLEAYAELDRPWVHTFTWNGKYTAHFNRPRLIYDWVDDLSAFEGNQARLEAQHKTLLSSAELVLVTAGRLYRQAQAVRPYVLLCPNGVDYAHFAAARRRAAPPPPGLEHAIATGRPVAGYHGALARWFDYGLLGAVAALRPDLSFVLIGPDHDGTLASSSLLSRPNIVALGARPYAEIPAYLSWFDVAMIPFRLNAITHATSPLKLFEYMAAGKPVVVTPMEESLRYAGALPAASPADFSQQIDLALSLRGDPDHLALLDRLALENTWETRAGQILEAISRASLV